MYLIDVAAYNAFALKRKSQQHLFKKDLKRQRRFSLEELGFSLVKPLIDSRIEKLKEKNFQCIKKPLLNCFIKVDAERIRPAEISKKISDENSIKDKRSLCQIMNCETRKRFLKNANVCSVCKYNFCKDHCSLNKTIICCNCT